MDILKESLEYEKEALNLYYALLEQVQDNVPLEELVRGLIKEETEHMEEVEKMTRAIPPPSA